MGQIIRASIDDWECSWSDECGKYLTSRSETAKGALWYLWEGEVNKDSTIKIEVKTSLVGIGKDEDKTFETLYYVSEDAPVREISMFGVGKKGYPLIKGRVIEIGSVTESDKRKSDIEEFLNKDF